MDLYLLNYADDRFGHKGGRFLTNQAKLNESARKQGVEKIVSWTWPQLQDTQFYQENKSYLDRSRFENGAVWKPFIVQQLLNQIQTGDIILYYDCGAYTINRPAKILTDLCIRNGGTLFHEWGEKNFKYTKRDAFVYMDCDTPKYHNAIALQNTWFLLQKSDFTENFINEWLQYNLDERIASYVKPNTCGLPDLLGFVENRGDQSIFTNLAIKYGIRSFRGAGGIQNRHIDQFIDSLSWQSQAKFFISTAKSHTKSWLKASVYQIRSKGKPLKFKIQSISFELYPYGGSTRQLWSGDSSKELLLNCLLSLQKSDLEVVEVGANVGVTTVPLAKKLRQGKIYAIEADPDLCQHLQDNLNLNDCLDRVTIVPVAASNTDGEKVLQINDIWSDTFNTIGKPTDANCRIVSLKKVPVITLTSVIEKAIDQRNLSRLDLMLIDASGAELPILQGSDSILACESSPMVVYNCLHRACLGFGYQPYEIQELMRAKGYRLFKLGNKLQLLELPLNENHQGFILGFKEKHFLMFEGIDFVFL
jgi:FkbM family methyltransferase